MCSVLLIGISLSMDAFAVTVTNAVTLRPFRTRDMLWSAVYFGGFQFLMPLLGALGKAEPLEADRIRKMVSTAAEHPEHIPEIAGFVDAHGGMEESEKVLEGFITEATEALRVLPESEERTYLEKLAHYAGSRKK